MLTAIWIVSILFALVFTAVISGAALGRVLDRAYRSRLRARAARATKKHGREQLIAEVDGELDQVRQQRSEVEAALERGRSGQLVLRRQALYEKICQLEDWRGALDRNL